MLEAPTLWQHQKDCFERAKDSSEYAILFEQGCGKTRTTIELLRHKYNRAERIQRTLIIGPIIILENWKREITQFSKIPEKEIAIVYGDKKKRLEAVASGANILVINFEALLIEEVFQAIVKWRPEIVIADEVHRIRNIKAKRTKRALLLADLAYTKYILTGTLVLNSPLDVFAPYRFLDGGKTFGKNFYAFRAQYFYDKNSGMPKQKYFPDFRIKAGAYEQMKELIYKKAMRVTKEEALDLPPLVKQTIFLEMDPVQKKLYESMKRDFIAFMKNKDQIEASVATLAITKALRLLQIVSGFLKTEENEVSLENPKIRALEELLEDLSGEHKILVWAVFKHNYKDIIKVCEKLGLKYLEIHGDVPNRQKFEAVSRFNTERDIRVLIAHPFSGGIGVSLTASDISIFYSRNFSLEQDLQAESRNHRGGSEIHSKITRIDLVVKGTIDELVQEALANKVEISEKILETWIDKL